MPGVEGGEVKRTPLRRKTPLRASAGLKAGSGGLRRSPLARTNPERQARRRKAYTKVIGSAFHKQLRYQAWERAGGYCECQTCVDVRTRIIADGVFAPLGDWSVEDGARAVNQVPVWFTSSEGNTWRRFRSKAGELHHLRYRLFGMSNAAELDDVIWVWKECHRRIEAEHGTRRRYFTGRVA